MSEEPWECPICHKTVLVGYMIHRSCLKEQIGEFQSDIKLALDEQSEMCELGERYKYAYQALLDRVLEWQKKWEEKLK